MRELRLRTPYHTRAWLRMEQVKLRCFFLRCLPRQILKGLAASSTLPRDQR